MNILLVNSNIVRCARSGYPLTPAPTGLISITGVLRRHGHCVRIRQVQSHVLAQDEESLPLLRAELQELLEQFTPDLIGISVRNVGAARRPANPFNLLEYYSVFYDARIVRAFRMLSGAPIAIGGTAFSIEPGLYVKCAQPDYGIIGEAEDALLALVEALEAGREPDDVPGLARTYADVEPACKTRNRVADLSTIGVGACDVVADFREHYYDPGGYAAVQTKRGCAMNCTYCTTPFLEGPKYRCRPMTHVIDEIRAYREWWGIKHFFLVDATFNHPLDQALEVCEALLQADLGVEWFTEITPLDLTDELCRMMKRSGCLGATMSPDSCSETVLKAYGKPFGMGEVKNAINLLRKHDIDFDTRLIVGGPGETMGTFAESVAFCSEHFQHDAVGFYDGMIVTSRAPVYDVAVKEGLIDSSRPYEDIVLQNDFRAMKGYEYFFPGVKDSRRELSALLDRACMGRHWRITSRDYTPDPNTGEFAFRKGISVQKGARPWWVGWARDDGPEQT